MNRRARLVKRQQRQYAEVFETRITDVTPRVRRGQHIYRDDPYDRANARRNPARHAHERGTAKRMTLL